MITITITIECLLFSAGSRPFYQSRTHNPQTRPYNPNYQRNQYHQTGDQVSGESSPNNPIDCYTGPNTGDELASTAYPMNGAAYPAANSPSGPMYAGPPPSTAQYMVDAGVQNIIGKYNQSRMLKTFSSFLFCVPQFLLSKIIQIKSVWHSFYATLYDVQI